MSSGLVFKFALFARMTRTKLYNYSPKYVRDTLNETVVLSDELVIKEKELILNLMKIDQQRLYLRYGFRSLRPFCVRALRLSRTLSRTQAQRIVTEVRRAQTTFDSGNQSVRVSFEEPVQEF